jgi:hypothetical protein
MNGIFHGMGNFTIWPGCHGYPWNGNEIRNRCRMEMPDRRWMHSTVTPRTSNGKAPSGDCSDGAYYHDRTLYHSAHAWRNGMYLAPGLGLGPGCTSLDPGMNGCHIFRTWRPHKDLLREELIC